MHVEADLRPPKPFTPQLVIPIATVLFAAQGFKRAKSCPPKPFTPQTCKLGADVHGAIRIEAASGNLDRLAWSSGEVVPDLGPNVRYLRMCLGSRTAFTGHVAICDIPAGRRDAPSPFTSS